MTLEVIKFKSDDIEVVKDGQQVFISIKKVCENLGIDSSRQIRKIQQDETFEARLIKVNTSTGLKRAWCIPLEKLNGWLFTINPNKVKPEVKQKLIAYKNECFKVLYNHFITKASAHTTHQMLGYKGALARLRNERRALLEQKRQLEEENERMRRWVANMESRRITSEELLELIRKGRRYDDLKWRYEKLRGRYYDLVDRMEVLRQCYVPSVKKIVEFFEGGE